MPTMTSVAAAVLTVVAGLSGGGSSIPPYVNNPYTGQIGTRSFVPNVKSGSSNYANCVTAHAATQAYVNIPQFIYPGWYVLNGVDTASVGLTYSVGLEYPGGTFNQLTWSASPNVVVGAALANTVPNDAGVALITQIPQGAIYKLHVFARVTSGSGGGLCILQATTSTQWVAQGEALESSGTVITDKSMGGVITDSGTGSFIYPVAILGTTTKASFGLLGDSRTLGTTSSGSAVDASGNTGHVAQSIGQAGYAYINVGVGGSFLRDANRSAPMRLGLLAYTSHLINSYGINDLRTGGLATPRTAAQVNSDFDVCARKLYNKPIFLATVAPQTTSSDGYATPGNQTADVLNSQRALVNARNLTIPSPYSGVIDLASRAQDATFSALWKSPNWTGDGLHNTALAYTDVVSSGVVPVAILAGLGAVSRYSQFALASTPVVFDINRASTLIATISGTAANEGTAFVWSAPVNITYNAAGWVDGGPALTFATASNTRLVGDAPMFASFSGVSGITLVILFRVPNLPSAKKCLMNVSTNGTTERATLYLDNTGSLTCTYRCLDADAGTTITAPAALIANTTYMVIANLDPIGNLSQLSVNGVVVTSGVFATSGVNFSATASSRVSIDTQITGDTQLDMVMRDAEFIQASVSTLAVRQKLEGDVAWRGGVAATVLPGGHPYFSAPPTSN